MWDSLVNLNKKLVLYFHNDPTTMLGSSSVNDRISLVKRCSKIIFNSNWSKKKISNQITFKPTPFKKTYCN